MSTSQKEIKQGRQESPPQEPPQPEGLVGKTVAFAIGPTELVPAKVLDYYETQTDNGVIKAIDYEYVEHSTRRVDAGTISDGLLEFRDLPTERVVTGKRARWKDPCRREDGGTMAVPQSGHFVPGTWFDPSGYAVSVDCIKDEIAEVRGIPKVPGTLGRVLQAAQPGRRVVEGPFDDFTAAYAAFRNAKRSFDTVIMLFSKRR